MTILSILLQEAQQGTSAFSSIFMIIALIAIFYFFMIRPQTKRQKEIRQFREKLQNGDKVVTAGGIYGKIKDLNEFMGEFYYQNYGLECIGLRYTVIYGKGRRRGGANYIKYTLNDPALGIPSVVDNATDTPNFVYVEDAARATILACDMPYKRAAYNVTGQFIPMMDLVDYVRKLIPDAQITTVPGEMDLAWKFDTTVEEEELGYKPSVDIYEGALITINDVREGAGLPPITVK